jgi:hypothetical protein
MISTSSRALLYDQLMTEIQLRLSRHGYPTINNPLTAISTLIDLERIDAQDILLLTRTRIDYPSNVSLDDLRRQS